MPKPSGMQLDAFDFPRVIPQAKGYLCVDHRASPGLPEDVARRYGYDPLLAREGKVFEADVLGCGHCPSAFTKRHGEDMIGRCPDHGYICDACIIASKDPSYVHRSRQEVIDLMTSGKFTVTGSMSLPIFTRKETTDG